MFFLMSDIWIFISDLKKKTLLYESMSAIECFCLKVSKLLSVSNHSVLPYGHWQAPAVAFQACSYPLTHCVK